ncbi:MAG: OmpA family protein [Pseudomonadota bacterium]
MRLRPENLVVTMLVCLLASCGPSADRQETQNSVCVEIPNGQYFQFIDGRLISTSSVQISEQERPPETARRIGATLAGMGYPWVALQWDGQVVIVSGLALDDNSRSDAFIATKSAFEADPVAGPLVQRVVNNMEVRDTEDAIAIRLTEELVEEDGLSWLRVIIVGNVATLEGTASSAQEKELGYGVGRSTVLSDLDASAIVNIVVDAIRVEGNGEPIGLALMDLRSEATVSECQVAFNQVMQGREVEFEPNESIVKKVSSRLLDAVTGVALLCEAHDIEIAGHTGPEEFNIDALELSQRRASSVRDYLMAYGVEPEALTARGYGSIGPIQPGVDANLVFPNTAFVVTARDS